MFLSHECNSCSSGSNVPSSLPPTIAGVWCGRRCRRRHAGLPDVCELRATSFALLLQFCVCIVMCHTTQTNPRKPNKAGRRLGFESRRWFSSRVRVWSSLGVVVTVAVAQSVAMNVTMSINGCCVALLWMGPWLNSVSETSNTNLHNSIRVVIVTSKVVRSFEARVR